MITRKSCFRQKDKVKRIFLLALLIICDIAIIRSAPKVSLDLNVLGNVDALRSQYQGCEDFRVMDNYAASWSQPKVPQDFRTIGNSAALQSQNPHSESFKVVGYLYSDDFSSLLQVPFERLTHINLAFLNPDKNGNLYIKNEKYIRYLVKHAKEAQVQTFISLAGGDIDDNIAAYYLKALQPENRTAFIEKLVAFTVRYDLDGIDVDIEWNLLPTITDLYTPFVLELKKALDTKDKQISAVLNVKGLHASVTQTALEAYDFINLMAYDKTGYWQPEHVGPHAPLSYVDEALHYWTKERGIHPKKLNLGVPFYAHDFETLKIRPYKDLVNANVDNAYRDQAGETFYNGWPTMVKKTQKVMKEFGGIMIWELASDTRNELSLLRAIDQTLKAGDCDGTGSMTFYADRDGDGYGDAHSPIQACQAPDSYVSNRADLDDTDEKIKL